MSSPAGNVLKAYGQGRKLAEQFDENLGREKPDPQAQKLDQIIYMLNQQYDPPDDPPGGGGNKKDTHTR